MQHALATYRPLERRIRKGDLDALLARWEFGKKLLEERGDKAKLPDGYLDQLCNALHNHGGRRELQNRMQFAEQYSTEAEVRAAFEEHGSWAEICARGMGARGTAVPAPGSETWARAVVEPIVDLKPHPRNYREHTPEQLAHIVKSIEEHDVFRNVVAARDGTILAGHGVVQAAGRMGRARVPVVRLDLDPESPAALKVLAADNEIANLAYDDDRKLTDMLREIMDAMLSDDDRTLIEAHRGKPLADPLLRAQLGRAADQALQGSGFDGMQLAARVLMSRMRSEIPDFDAAAEWLGAGLPEVVAPGIHPRVIVTCWTFPDRDEVVKRLGATVRKKSALTLTWSVWFPDRPRVQPSLVEFADGGQDDAEEDAATRVTGEVEEGGAV